MRIPLPVNYGAMPGGYFNPARISDAQAAYAPMQAQANALLPMEQAEYMPYQIQAQMLSNPMLWMASQGNPQMMNSMISNLTSSMPKTNMMNMMPMNGGGLMGMLLGHYMGKSPTDSAAASATQMASALPATMQPYIQQYGLSNVKSLGNGIYGAIKEGQPVTFQMPGA